MTDEDRRSQYISGVAPRPRPETIDDGARRTVPVGPPDGPSSEPILLNEVAQKAVHQLVKALEKIGGGIADAGDAGRVLSQHAVELRSVMARPDMSHGVLEKRVLSLEAELRAAKRQAVSEVLRTLEQNDEFLALLIEEHTAELRQAKRERDEVLAQVARLRSISPTGTARAPGAEEPGFPPEPPTARRPSHVPQQRTKTDPGLGSSPTSMAPRANNARDEMPTARPPAQDLGDRLSEVQRQLVVSNETVDKLLADKQRSLELIRRLQAQRDDAHRELLHLKRQALDSSPTKSRPSHGQPSAEQKERPTDPAPALPLVSFEPQSPQSVSPAGHKPESAWDLDGSLPAPPLSLGSALPRTRRPSEEEVEQSEPPPMELGGAFLNIAPPPLGAFHEESPAASAHARPVLRAKPSLAERPLVTYSFRPDSDSTNQTELGKISLKPSRDPST